MQAIAIDSICSLPWRRRRHPVRHGHDTRSGGRRCRCSCGYPNVAARGGNGRCSCGRRADGFCPMAFRPSVVGMTPTLRRKASKGALDVPIIAMSGLATPHPHPQPDHFGLAPDASCCLHLHKPFVPNELRTAIQTCLDSPSPVAAVAKARPPSRYACT